MNLSEKIKICSTCQHRKRDLRRGIVCGLTDQKPDFDAACESYCADDAAVARAKANEEADDSYTYESDRPLFEPDLTSPKPRFISCLLWIFFGALCLFGFANMIIGAMGGESFRFTSYLSAFVGVSMLWRGIQGCRRYKISRPMPRPFTAFVWLLIGVPSLASLWFILMAFFNVKELWPWFLNGFYVAVGFMAICSVYEEKDDAFYLIKCYGVIYAIGTILSIPNLITELTTVSIITFAVRLLVSALLMGYLYISKSVKVVLPESQRSESKVGKWLTIICVSLISIALVLSFVGLNYDTDNMVEQYRIEDGYHTDGIVAFKIPSHYVIEEVENDGLTIFSIKNSETEATETITLVSEFSRELTKEEFDEYYEGWKLDDFPYLSTSVVKEREDVLDGKHYHYRSVYFEEYGSYWDFAIVNLPDVKKHCIISIYTTDPGKKVYFFIRNLKFQ